MDALVIAILVMAGLSLFLLGLLVGSVLEERLNRGSDNNTRLLSDLPPLPDFLQ